MQLRDRLLGFLQRNGMALFLDSPTAACQLLSEASNSTFRVYATVGPSPCGTPPTSGSTSATLSFKLTTSEVVLVAWSPG